MHSTPGPTPPFNEVPSDNTFQAVVPLNTPIESREITRSPVTCIQAFEHEHERTYIVHGDETTPTTHTHLIRSRCSSIFSSCSHEGQPPIVTGLNGGSNNEDLYSSAYNPNFDSRPTTPFSEFEEHGDESVQNVFGTSQVPPPIFSAHGPGLIIEPTVVQVEIMDSYIGHDGAPTRSNEGEYDDGVGHLVMTRPSSAAVPYAEESDGNTCDRTASVQLDTSSDHSAFIPSEGNTYDFDIQHQTGQAPLTPRSPWYTPEDRHTSQPLEASPGLSGDGSNLVATAPEDPKVLGMEKNPNSLTQSQTDVTGGINGALSIVHDQLKDLPYVFPVGPTTSLKRKASSDLPDDVALKRITGPVDTVLGRMSKISTSVKVEPTKDSELPSVLYTQNIYFRRDQ